MYTLNVKETKNKSGKFLYTITDENGKVISERKSNREYVAALADGSMYFGRLDLIGKGDHGKKIKMYQTPAANETAEQKERAERRLKQLNAIAYLAKPQRVAPLVPERLVRDIEALPTCERLVSDNGSHIAYFTNKDYANEASEKLSIYWREGLGAVYGPFIYGHSTKQFYEVRF